MAYSRGSVFDEPQCLIKCEAQNRLVADQDVLGQLSGVEEQLNVIAIAGLYRTGKSYLLTRLAGKYKGFPLGSTINSTTKGIWAWCVKHPVDSEQKLLLLDTEGLGDVKKGDQNHDNHIFLLATLLSSTLVYNMKSPFDQDALLKLQCISDMAANLQISKNKEVSPDDDFDLFFPMFILALRDCSTDLVNEDGQEITPDQYFENCLDAKPGEGSSEVKLLLRKYFKKRKCFTFGPPGMPKVLKIMETLKDDDLDESFVESTRMFLDYVYKCEPLSSLNGKSFNGRMFSCLVNCYVDAIRDGDVPIIQSALESMAISENQNAVKESIQTYITQMNGQLSIPAPEEQPILAVHIHCKEIAWNVFLKHSFTGKEKYKKEIDIAIDNEYSNFVKRNHEESRKRCKAALDAFHSVIKRRHLSYSVAGGYKIYEADREELKRKYYAMTTLGVMKETMYDEFTKGIMTEEQSILLSDEMMTQKEVDNELKRKQAEQAEKQTQILNQKKENEKNEREKKEKLHQEELDKLAKQREIENEKVKQKIADTQRLRDKENERCQNDGFWSYLMNRPEQRLMNRLWDASGDWIRKNFYD